jgi:hypothetical protein
MNTGGAMALSPQLATDIFSLLHSDADVMSKPGPIQLESQSWMCSGRSQQGCVFMHSIRQGVPASSL